MCDLCNGALLEERMRSAELDILVRGFSKVAVNGPVSWMYTIGLTSRSHPELLIAGTDLPAAGDLLDRLADRVLLGEQLEPGKTVEEEDGVFGLALVHPSRLGAGLCAVWDLYDRRSSGPGRLQVLQVQIPDDWFCRCHAGSQPRLDLPGALPGSPNRETRRRRRRRR